MTRSGLLAIAAGVCLSGAALARAPATKQSNAGDSISQGFAANGGLGDHADLSWVQGTRPEIGSVYKQYIERDASFAQEPESVTGAELVGGGDNLAAQASRICAQAVKPDRVSVLLGGNDVCGRPRSKGDDPAANMYSVETWTNALRAGLDQLAACLPAGALVHVLSTPRVDQLFEAGHQKSFWCPYVVWPVARVCRLVTAETDPVRRAMLGARINAYNVATTREVLAYHSNSNGKNPNAVEFVTDWQGSIEEGHANSSFGTYAFTGPDINGTDCFHPSISGQRKLACAAWASHPDGTGQAGGCFQ